ncbi:cytochrome c oxidase subunit II [Micromonospora deserti]|nr:cytochrome c oxidase subunit II [Micromonospora deserti]
MMVLAVGLLEPRGPVAETIADLWWLLLGLGTAVFVVFAVLLARGLSRTPGEAEPDVRKRVGRWLVGGGVLMPAIVLVIVFAATVWAMRVMPTTASRDALVVEIVGHQWWFEVHYPDEAVTTTNELHLPVGRRVVLRLTSADVIHSFWVPELGGKMDMLPDDTNALVLQADEPGEYYSRCAEFCGLHHADMKMLVIAEPPDRFAAWVAAQR